MLELEAKSLTEKNLKVEVVEFSEEYKPELIIFCNKCKKLGFTLNESLKAMKLRDSVDGLRKPDDSFRDILRNIKKKHKGSDLKGSPNQNTMNKNADF